jgi:hypothetical protein
MPEDITGGIFACLAPLAMANPIPTSTMRGPLQDAQAEASLAVEVAGKLFRAAL